MKTILNRKNDRLILAAKLADDRLKLFIDVEPLAGAQIEVEELLSILQELIPRNDLDTGVLEDVCKHLNKGDKVLERRISKGKPPENGADGKIVWLVKRYEGEKSKREVQSNEKGQSNFLDLHLFDNVEKGQVVGRIYPPKKGEDGIDALQKPIPAKPGKPATLGKDKTLSQRPSQGEDKQYEEIVAEMDGYLTDDAGRWCIKEELVINGTLDFRYGNINFVGSVKVTGDVMQGVSITSKGIEIYGSVQSGVKLTSIGGDIVIKGFIYGGSSSKVITDKNFKAHVLQEVHAEVLGKIVIDKEVVSSELRTEAILEMPKGTLVGGNTYCVGGVEASVIGNDAGLRTTIHLCSDVETRAEYANLLLSIENHVKAIDLLKGHIGPLLQNPSRIKLLNTELRKKMEALLHKYHDVEKSLVVLNQKKEEMLQGGKENKEGRVSFQKSLFEGVEIHHGEKIFFSKAEAAGPASIEYKEDAGEFVQGEYKPLPSYDDPSDKKKER